MRKLLTILFIIASVGCVAQTPTFQPRSNGAFTPVDYRLAARWNFYVAYNLTDTSLNGGLDTLGAMLHVRSGSLQGVWYRDSVSTGGHHWQRLTPTSESYWTLNGTDLYPNSTSYDVGIGTTNPSYKLHVVNGGTFYFDGTRIGLSTSTNNNKLFGDGSGSLIAGSNNIGFGDFTVARTTGDNNLGFGNSSLFDAIGENNTGFGNNSGSHAYGDNNTNIGNANNLFMYGSRNTSLASQANTAAVIASTTLDNTVISVGTTTITGSTVATFITATGLSVGDTSIFNMVFSGTLPPPFTVGNSINKLGIITSSNTISFLNSSTFTGQGTGTFDITTYNKQDNSIAIGYNVTTDSSNQIAIGNDNNTVLKIRNFIVDLTDVPATGEVLTWNGTEAIWDTITGGGGGAYSFLSPLSETAGVVSINNASADGSTKGAATFTASDFNSNGAGLISIDYNNGQAASSTLKGFLSSTDWQTFNNKQNALPSQTGHAGEYLTTDGANLSWSAVSGGGGITSLDGLTAATQIFAVGTTGTSPSWSVSGGNTHTINIPTTSASNTGLVTPTLFNTWNAKQDAITGAATTVTTSNLTSQRAVISNSLGKLDVSATTSTELGYVSGVTSSIQTQLNNKAPLVSKTFQALSLSGGVIQWAYGSGYNATYTLTADRSIVISGDADGDYGTLIITQNATGGYDLEVPHTDYLQDGINVVGDPYTIDLPNAANSIAIVSWVNHSGVRYWTFGYYHQ